MQAAGRAAAATNRAFGLLLHWSVLELTKYTTPNTKSLNYFWVWE